MAAEFLSTLSLRRATIEFDSRHSDQNISIHALLAESDTNYQRDDGDPAAFLSTLSLRRATAMGQLAAQLNEISIHALLAESDRPPGNSCGTNYLHFYPRSPCGERRMMKLFSQLSTDISIHALLAESDRCCPCAIIAPAISIHALLAESDLLPFAMTITALDFYPRSPCGERHTRGQGAPLGVPYFYPRSPCGERLSARCAAPYPYFYPRSPCGERPGSVSGISSKTAISIHALLAESDNQSKHFERSK